MKRTCISTILLLPVAALYFCVAATANADTLEVEPGINLYYTDEGKGTRESFNGVNYNRAEFTAAFAQWMVKRKLTPAELRWITEIMESTPNGIAVQLAADALFADYRPELVKLSQEIPTLHVLGEEDASAAKLWLQGHAPKAKIEVLGRHMMFWEHSEAFNKVVLDFLGRSKNEQTSSKKK